MGCRFSDVCPRPTCLCRSSPGSCLSGASRGPTHPPPSPTRSVARFVKLDLGTSSAPPPPPFRPTLPPRPAPHLATARLGSAARVTEHEASRPVAAAPTSTVKSTRSIAHKAGDCSVDNHHRWHRTASWVHDSVVCGVPRSA